MTQQGSSNVLPWIEHYQEGVPEQIALPPESVPQMIARAVEKFADRPALEFFGRRFSYREFGDAISRAAQALLELGVKPGQRVAMVLPNCPQAAIAFHAIQRIGAVVVQHNPLYTARELRTIFSDHEAVVAIVWTKCVEKIQQMPADIAPKAIISVDITKAMPLTTQFKLALPVKKARAARENLTASVHGTTTWESFMRGPRLSEDHPMPAPEDIAVIQYTSGTTGEPKGAMLSHRNLYANALQGRAIMPDVQDGKEVSYAILPVFHAFGMTLFLTYAFHSGMMVVLFPKFEVSLVFEALKKSPPTMICAAPPIYERIAIMAKREKVDLSTVRFAISGAMTLPNSVVELWESVTSGRLVEGYGMTESSPITFCNPLTEQRRVGTIGIPVPSTLVKVVDVEDSTKEVPVGEPGELMVHGPQVFHGYWNKPDETSAVLSADGWLRTGDVVTLDKDGFCTIVDRKKDIIITGGFNVSPTEVEHVLNLHDDVVESGIVGLPTKSGNDQIVAAVVMKEGAELQPAALRRYLKERLAVYKVPVKFVEVPALPKNVLGKLLRKDIVKLLGGDR
ncbi:AMP-binding protein [Dermabacteraceae bacterium P13101]